MQILEWVAFLTAVNVITTQLSMKKRNYTIINENRATFPCLQSTGHLNKNETPYFQWCGLLVIQLLYCSPIIFLFRPSKRLTGIKQLVCFCPLLDLTRDDKIRDPFKMVFLALTMVEMPYVFKAEEKGLRKVVTFNLSLFGVYFFSKILYRYTAFAIWGQ